MDKDGALQQEYEGTQVLADLVRNLAPSVSSTNILELDGELQTLTNRATIDISFDIPQFFPIPTKIIESRGSAAIQAGMNRDLDGPPIRPHNNPYPN